MINLVSLRTFSCPQFYKPVTGQVLYFATQYNRWTSYIREIPKFKDLGFWTKRSNPAQCVTSPWRPLNAMLRWPFRKNLRHTVRSLLKFIYSEKATKFCKISTLLLSYVVPIKSKVEILKNFVAFSECMNFNRGCTMMGKIILPRQLKFKYSKKTTQLWHIGRFQMVDLIKLNGSKTSYFTMKSYFYKSLMREGFKTFYFQPLTSWRL